MTTQSKLMAMLKTWGKATRWEGYPCYEGLVDGRACKVVVPDDPDPDRRWAWRAEFFGEFAAVDLELVARGFLLAYMDVSDLYGSPRAVSHWDVFYRWAIGWLELHPHPALIGLSRGGLLVYNWAIQNPEKTGCIYADAPVMDIKSWPGGKGGGTGSPEDWQKCLAAYGLSEAEALVYPGNPVDNLGPLAARQVALMHVCGMADEVVPVSENTALAAERYRELGGDMTVLLKGGVGHHPHGLEIPTAIVEFITQHTK
jgi:pimeloyl-ACP methyl ester carboxylesterase